MKLGIVTSFALLVMQACGSSPPKPAAPTVQDGAKIVDYAAALAHCRDVGRDAGSFAAYVACEKDAGL
jgi:hypothetical protein